MTRAAVGLLKQLVRYPQQPAACSPCPRPPRWRPSLPRLAVELMKPGSYVTLRNAKIDMFRGSMRLAVNQARGGGALTGLWVLVLRVVGVARQQSDMVPVAVALRVEAGVRVPHAVPHAACLLAPPSSATPAAAHPLVCCAPPSAHPALHCPPPPLLLQWGKMEPASGQSFQPKADYNLSLVEYELIPVRHPGPTPPLPPAGSSCCRCRRRRRRCCCCCCCVLLPL